MSTVAERERRPGGRAGFSGLLLGLGVLGGLAALVAGLVVDPVRTHTSVLVSFVYWTGLAFGAVLVSAIFHMTSSGWGKRVARLGECAVALVPLSLLAYLGVALGHGTLVEAARGHPLEHYAEQKQVWLEPAFLLARDGLGLALLSAVAVAYVYYSLRPELGARLVRQDAARPRGLAGLLVRGYGEPEAERERAHRMRDRLAPALGILYAVVLSLLAFDQVMALDPNWVSTLFGGYYFVTSLFHAFALLALMSVLARTRAVGSARDYGEQITVPDRHDLGKLLFAFTMLSADFFWSQFVVIWYANIPEETAFVIRRTRFEPWDTIAWSVLLGAFAVPFVLLLFRRVKRTRATLAAVAGLVMTMLWVERFLLIAPSTWERADPLPFGPIELGLAVGFAALAVLAYRAALSAFVLPTEAATEARALEQRPVAPPGGGADV